MEEPKKNIGELIDFYNKNKSFKVSLQNNNIEEPISFTKEELIISPQIPSVISIPLIGALCLIRTDLLKRLIESIDYYVDTFVILLQGNLSFDISEINNHYIKKFVIINASFNIGVSRGWNYILKRFPSKYWIICGDDTFFEEGSLEKICNYMSTEKALENVFIGYKLKVNDNISNAEFTNFILTQKSLDKVGLFDENIYPAYFEDNDYWKRIVLSGEKTFIIENVNIFHANKDGGGSVTLHSVDNDYRSRMNKCYEINGKYFHSKWNSKEGLMTHDLNNSFTRPFNNNNYNIKEHIEHKNFHGNQEILLNHRETPNFKTKLYINLYENGYEYFNSKIYKYFNCDLGHLSDSDTIYHFIEFGINEDRLYSYNFPKGFDPNYYRLLNNDLKNLNEDELQFHYMEYGFNENRTYNYIFPKDFNINCYRLANPDLRHKCDYDLKFHFAEYGFNENRFYSVPIDFNVDFYRSINFDLREMNNEQLINHYIENGNKECRLYKNIDNIVTIVISRYEKNTDWIKKFKKYGNLKIIVYDKENDRNIYNIPLNKGNEASVYLKYIIDHYDELLDYTFFVHDEEFSNHHNGSLIDKLIDSIKGNKEYININHCIMGSIIENDWYSEIMDWYNSFVEKYIPYNKLPNKDWTVGHMGSSQFLVHKKLILNFPKKFYEDIYMWLLVSNYPNSKSSRFLEYTWHLLWQIYPTYVKDKMEK